MIKKAERVITQNICLPLGLREKIAKEAQRRGLSISELIRGAVVKEIESRESDQENVNGEK